jgi:hypothetical protein
VADVWLAVQWPPPAGSAPADLRLWQLSGGRRSWAIGEVGVLQGSCCCESAVGVELHQLLQQVQAVWGSLQQQQTAQQGPVVVHVGLVPVQTSSAHTQNIA